MGRDTKKRGWGEREREEVREREREREEGEKRQPDDVTIERETALSRFLFSRTYSSIALYLSSHTLRLLLMDAAMLRDEAHEAGRRVSSSVA